LPETATVDEMNSEIGAATDRMEGLIAAIVGPAPHVPLSGSSRVRKLTENMDKLVEAAGVINSA
jgi:hypothetical protein